MYLGKYYLTGKTALITGGGRGIGLATSFALHEAGAKVVISDIDPKTLAEGAEELAAGNGPVETVLLDVSDAGTVRPLRFGHKGRTWRGAA